MKELVCIVCPRGCTMKIEENENEIIVSGNFCKRGADFAKTEMTNHMRTICTTVKTAFPDVPVLPVRVSAEIPKNRIFDVMAEVNKTTLTRRISRGEAVIKNVLDLGVDIIATSDILIG